MVMSWDVLAGKADTGDRVVIIGGNAVGLETATFLAEQGTISPEVLHFLVTNKAEKWERLEELVNRGNKKVTVVEMMEKAGKEIGPSTKWTIMMENKRLGVEIRTSTRAMEVTTEGLVVEKDGEQSLIAADTIVIAAGSRPLNELQQEIEGVVSEIHLIGDASSPRKVMEAIREGHLTGLSI